MITSWSECRAVIAADLDRHRAPRARTLLMEPQTRWLVRLRVTEWWCNTRGGPIGMLLKWRLAETGARLGLSIPINRVGAGLRLPHPGVIAINGDASVGRNCQILPGVVLGGTDRGAPTVGDNVFLGPGVKVIGPVHVGPGAVLGANAVLVENVPAGTTWLAPRAHPATRA